MCKLCIIVGSILYINHLSQFHALYYALESALVFCINFLHWTFALCSALILCIIPLYQSHALDSTLISYTMFNIISLHQVLCQDMLHLCFVFILCVLCSNVIRVMQQFFALLDLESHCLEALEQYTHPPNLVSCYFIWNNNCQHNWRCIFFAQALFLFVLSYYVSWMYYEEPLTSTQNIL